MDSIPSLRFRRILTRLDLLLFLAGVSALLCIVLFASRVNIASDSVDYYAILQELTSPEEKPIVSNLPFVEQRSPGFPIAALIPYGVIDHVLDPLSATEKVMDEPGGGSRHQLMPIPQGNGFPGSMPPWALMEEQAALLKKAPGSESVQFPSMPVLLRTVLFKDFYIPMSGSWFRWKTALALAVTSYFFLFGGIIAVARTLKFTTASVPGYSLMILLIFLSPIFMQNIIERPLFSTLSAFGMSSFFMFYFMTGVTDQNTRKLVTAGVFLGSLVLIRLEAAIFAIALAAILTACGKWRTAFKMASGSTVALAVLTAYNYFFFKNPFHIGILKGDINQFGVNFKYIFENLAHPQCGILFWSPILVLGLAGIMASRRVPLRLLGWSSIALIVVYLFRIPVMYTSMGSGIIDIGGLPITTPGSPSEVWRLIRLDINRYVTIFAPFAVLGLKEGIGRLANLRRPYVHQDSK